MKFVLNKKPKNPVIISGFPSIGLISTITTKFLTDHLEVEDIGYIESENLVPLTAIHNSRIVHPITFYYNKKYNLLIIQSLTDVQGFEWDLANTLLEVGRAVNAKELIVVEGIPNHVENEINLYYFSSKSKYKLKPLTEGVVMGTTAALLLKAEDFPVTCIFAEAHSQLPDSEAAAKVVEALDDHMNLKLDYRPLLEAAKKFEKNLKIMLEKKKENISNTTSQEKKELSYFG
ncbi:MAG TPA: PAC2 family protein [Candidatus Nanoarchaeia archaeon]|nr:PAC2 family protein [Candidatus Nanoarchaeia archaeon]